MALNRAFSLFGSSSTALLDKDFPPNNISLFFPQPQISTDLTTQDPSGTFPSYFSFPGERYSKVTCGL